MAGTFGQWGKVFKTLKDAPKDLEAARKIAVLGEAQFFRTKILEGLREQAPGGKKFKALTPETLAIRKFLGFKGTKALLKHGDLRNAIVVEEKDDLVFVGVLRSAKNERGQSMVNVAQVQEEGSKPIIIKMTPKMSALLHAAFRQAGIERKEKRPTTGIIVVQIPARPFISPVFEEYGKANQVEKRMAARK